MVWKNIIDMFGMISAFNFHYTIKSSDDSTLISGDGSTELKAGLNQTKEQFKAI
jgi:hypothetical protein